MIDKLILKSLTEKLSLEERHQLNKWLDEDRAHRDMMEAFELYWDGSQYGLEQEKSLIYENIKTQIQHKKEVGGKQAIPWLKFLRYAAIFILISGLSIFIYSTLDIKEKQVAIRHIEKTSLAGQNISFKLPDGSHVKLNAGSRLIVPEVFEGNKREVELTGEAFFEVSKDPSRPFIVKVQDLEVEVLGTSFIVKAYKDELNQLVAVKTGRVNVKSIDTGKEVDLVPNQMSVLNEYNELQKIPVEDYSLIFGWINKEVVFKDQTIDQVLQQIERWFGVKITVQKELTSKRLYTAHHYNPPIEEVLRSLSFVYEFEFEKIDEDEIVIK